MIKNGIKWCSETKRSQHPSPNESQQHNRTSSNNHGVHAITLTIIML